MKKSLLIVGLLMAMSLSATAQYDGPAFGFRLGPNFNWVGSKGEAYDSDMRVGFDVGFVFEYYFTENYALVTGVNVNFLKGEYDYRDKRNISPVDSIPNYLLGDVERTFKTTEYEIPLMLKLVTPEIGNIPLRAYAQIGGAFGLTPVVKVKDEFKLDELELNDTEFKLAKGQYNPIHASLRVGAGAEYAILETTRVFLGVYYSYDFLNGISSGAQGITHNYRKYYGGDKDLGERPARLDIHQHRIGLEVGVLF